MNSMFIVSSMMSPCHYCHTCKCLLTLTLVTNMPSPAHNFICFNSYRKRQSYVQEWVLCSIGHMLLRFLFHMMPLNMVLHMVFALYVHLFSSSTICRGIGLQRHLVAWMNLVLSYRCTWHISVAFSLLSLVCGFVPIALLPWILEKSPCMVSPWSQSMLHYIEKSW